MAAPSALIPLVFKETEPDTLIPPIVLFEIAIAPGVPFPARIPVKTALLPLVENVILPVEA